LVLWCLGTKDVFPDAKYFLKTKQSIISTVVQRTLEVQLLEFDPVCQKIYQCWCAVWLSVGVQFHDVVDGLSIVVCPLICCVEAFPS
jgi:hypothetical protein